MCCASSALANTTPLGNTRIFQTTESTQTCNSPFITNPFTPYGDTRDYVLAPGGSFDGDIAGWQFRRGASLVQTTRGKSLSLPPGASAISPSMCIDLDLPTFRFSTTVTKNAGGAEIEVEVVHLNVAQPEFTEVKKFDGKQGLTTGQSWHLSDDIELKPDFGGAKPGARQAALRFTALTKGSTGSWRVDDIYVDPKRH